MPPSPLVMASSGYAPAPPPTRPLPPPIPPSPLSLGSHCKAWCLDISIHAYVAQLLFLREALNCVCAQLFYVSPQGVLQSIQCISLALLSLALMLWPYPGASAPHGPPNALSPPARHRHHVPLPRTCSSTSFTSKA